MKGIAHAASVDQRAVDCLCPCGRKPVHQLQERFELTRQKAEEYLKMDDNMAKISSPK